MKRKIALISGLLVLLIGIFSLDFIRSHEHQKVTTSPVVVTKKGQNNKKLGQKGKALEEILTKDWKKNILQQVADLNQDGLRVLGLAIKNNPQPSTSDELSTTDETNMIFLGYLAFLDPPKNTAAKAIKALAEHGTKVKIITGDSLVTEAVCRNISFDVTNIITRRDIQSFSPHELGRAVESSNVFVKVSPEQKALIVKTLRDNGHVVGFLGDGINDAPSMKAADVGISVDTAVDIAKQSASIVLLQKDLMILERGVVVGRQTFGNIMKYIKATCSSNFGNVFSVLCASAFLPFLPMQPMQLLFPNLVYDLSCLSIPWDNIDPEYLKVPRKWGAKSIASFMKYIGPTSSVFDITTYLAMYFIICPAVIGHGYGATSGAMQQDFIKLFNSGWFVESLWTQTLVLHVLRTGKIPFIQSHASGLVTLVTSLALTWIALGITWLLHRQLAPAILFTTSGAFMLVNAIIN